MTPPTTLRIDGIVFDKDGTLLLEQGQNGFTVLGESHLMARVTDRAMLRLYRQDINLPYLNRQDNRMVPNTFEAYLLFDDADPEFNYVGGHVRQMKRRNETDFISMSEAAGASSAEKGVSMLGALYRFTDDIDIGAINYHGWDTMNIFYTEAHSAWPLTGELALRTGHRRQRHAFHARHRLEHLLQLVHAGHEALPHRHRSQRVARQHARKHRQAVACPRVVLHGAGAQRVELGIDREILL